MKKNKTAKLIALFGLVLLLVTAVACDAIPEEVKEAVTNPETPSATENIINVDVTVPETENNDDGIYLVSSNLGKYVNTITDSSPAEIEAGEVPYFPVYVTDVHNESDQPYLTFTFSENIDRIFGTEDLSGGGISLMSARNLQDASEIYVYDIDTSNPDVHTRSPKKVSSVSVSGATVTFVLPSILDIQGNGSDGSTLTVGNKYIVDFIVYTETGNYAQLAMAFKVTETIEPLGTLNDTDLMIPGIDIFQDAYALFEIDSNQVFYLEPASEATHDTAATDAESVKVGINTVTSFNSYDSRYGNGTGVVDGDYASLNALDTAVGFENRTEDDVYILFPPVVGADGYYAYTSTNSDLSSDWTYLGTYPAGGMKGVFPDGGSYDVVTISLADHAIEDYRAVRIVPYNAVTLGTPAHIDIVDTVRPVTDTLNDENHADFFFIDTVTYTGHMYQPAHEGHVIKAQSLNLLAPISQPDQTPEAIKVSNVTGSFSVSTTVVDGGVSALTVAEFEGSEVAELLDGDRVLQLGDAVGVLSGNTLSIYIHVDCEVTGENDSITYTAADTEVTCSALRVYYTDLYGNQIIAQDNNDGSVNWIDS